MDEPAHYEIQVAERIDEGWSRWFGGLEIAYGESGGTSLQGEMPDQPALFGVLGIVRDLGLTLISVQRDPDISYKPVTVAEIPDPEAPLDIACTPDEGR